MAKGINKPSLSKQDNAGEAGGEAAALTPVQEKLSHACAATVERDEVEAECTARMAEASRRASDAWKDVLSTCPSASKYFRATVGPWKGQLMRVRAVKNRLSAADKAQGVTPTTRYYIERPGITSDI